ncbi:MAG TPA: DoxX family protein [Polyangia bacterium]|jgi:putative oxidoreductase
MSTSQRLGSLAARLALAAIFIVSGAGKLAGLAGTAGFIGSKGLPAPLLLAALAGIVELVGGMLLAAGLRAKWAAAALALFLVPATALFHNPAGLSGMEAQMQLIQLFKNLAIIGGLLAVVTYGAGALSLDAVLGRGRRRAGRVDEARQAA